MISQILSAESVPDGFPGKFRVVAGTICPKPSPGNQPHPSRTPAAPQPHPSRTPANHHQPSIYTFVEQIRRHQADHPFAYFEWVFEKPIHNPDPEELEALLPVNWIKTRPAANRLIEIPAA